MGLTLKATMRVIKALAVPGKENPGDFIVRARAIQRAAVELYKTAAARARSAAAAKIVLLRRRVKRNAAVATYMKVLGELDAMFRKLDDLYCSTLRQANEECLRIAIMAAETILEEKIGSDHSYTSKRIAAALSDLTSPRGIQIALNPSECARVKQDLQEREAHLSLKEESSYAPGEARIECHSGAIEINWRAQLMELHAAMRRDLIKKVEEQLTNGTRGSRAAAQ